jgi:hypothetical protein
MPATARPGAMGQIAIEGLIPTVATSLPDRVIRDEAEPQSSLACYAPTTKGTLLYRCDVDASMACRRLSTFQLCLFR